MPPCRSWSRHLAHQAKPEPGERDLGLWCIRQVEKWGGVLEQPAGSRLFDHLPAGIGRRQYVAQGWFGCPTLKPTWLWWVGYSPPAAPFRLVNVQRADAFARLSSNRRSATTPEFARWLLNALT
jgi:hypothetical protein